MSCCSIEVGDLAALVVKPKVAWKMLACSNTHGYELLAAGELESFRDGRSRKITVNQFTDLLPGGLRPKEPLPSNRGLPAAAERGARSHRNRGRDQRPDR